MIVFKEREKESRENTLSAEETVRNILTDVRARGDEAVQDYTERFDGFRPSRLRVKDEELKKARSGLDKETEKALVFAAERIENFARAQRSCLKDLRYEISPGVVLGHRLIPIASCGCYVPAGRYPLPSSALMSVIPARVAGVTRIAACSPGQKDGRGIHPAVLAALDIAGVDEVYCMGGAQAIGAFAWGTETISPVDMIVGPGNRYVAEAKRQVSGSVGIDMLAGPSEAVILADESADPEWVAADLLAQSEHDADAWAVLITTSPSLAEATAREVERQGELLSTGEAALESWRNNGRILVAESVEEGIAAANEI
ncbi:MAG: histidinol dehydrogenase, partial [Synergistaceae bacterium]|nr:histidinol dehydrogenase [Synergistaceae bacterium]